MDIIKFSIMNLDTIILRIVNLGTFTKQKIDYAIIEFSDGIYFSQYDKFLLRDEVPLNQFFNSNCVGTLRYFNVPFHIINKKTNNTLWESKLRVQFSKSKEPSFEKFLALFGNLLFDSQLQSKLNAIFILGISNSGKTSLVLNIVKLAYGIQNVGTFSTDLKFLLENTVGKDVIIGDEMTFSKPMRSSLLKISGGEVININQKFLSSQTLELTRNIIFASNPSKEINLMLEDKAFIN